MKDILERLPVHVEDESTHVRRLRMRRQVLGVITEGERGMNLYPGPARVNAR
jgi:uncharacterized protein (DUF2252 family)